MDCRRIRKLLSEYDLGVLADAPASAVSQHLERCAACRGELERLRAVVAALGSMSATAPPRDLWPAVQARLQPRRPLRWFSQRAWQPALAAAVGVLMALALWFGRPSIQPRPVRFPLEAPCVVGVIDDHLVTLMWRQPLADDVAAGFHMAMLTNPEVAP